MKHLLCSLLLIPAASLVTSAQDTYLLGSADPESTLVASPERAIILSGGENGVHRDVLGVLYDTERTFDDPDAPRFLLIDRKGNTVFGLGGAVEGVMQYDFDGSIDSYGFHNYDIPVPFDGAKRSRFGADASRSTLVFNLLRKTQLGVLSAYIQANFSNANYGFKLKQAYLRLNRVTFGLARSTFQDALATPATIDYAGPVGSIDRKNFQLQYKALLKCGFGFAVAAEMPTATYSVAGSDAEAISQRVPDFPAFIQYQWAGGKSHVRASAIARALSYRDLASLQNRLAAGYGVQFSGGIKATDFASLNFQATYGKGIASYMCDIEGDGFDLFPSATVGKLTPPRTFGFSGGARINPCKNFFMTASYSMMRLYDQETLGPDTYRRGNYAVVNAFYNPLPELQIGLEYLHGTRTDMSGLSGHANRIQTMVKYSF